MPSEDSNNLKHIFLAASPQKERYTSPKHGFSKDLPTQIRERDQHGFSLKIQINSITNSIPDIKLDRSTKGYREDYGIYIEFEGEEGFELKYESLDNERFGIEVENVREIDGKSYATVYVPDGMLKHFLTKIDQYLDHEKDSTKTHNPKNKQLLENITNIHLATLKAFWTGIENFDSINRSEDKWWEIWIRAGKDNFERNQIQSDFLEACSRNSIQVKDTKIVFPERTVFLAKTSISVMANSLTVLNCLAEIRNPQETAETFLGMPLPEQREWVEDLISRTVLEEGNIPAVCIIDTGVNNGHPLLQVGLNDSDMLTYNEVWGKNDNHGHGTGMAGIALYGDLFPVFSSRNSIQLVHRLESVKLFDNSYSHEPELYGAVTLECISRSEINAPERKRIHCLAITSNEHQYSGHPSSWSSSLDQSSFGEEENSENKRLIIVSAGNVEDMQTYYSYPSNNDLNSIHDPGQSWNSLTVGGFTQKTFIDTELHGDYVPIASHNKLAPSSSTSVNWENETWPLKPDIVLESGNYAKEVSSNYVSSLDSLSLLTTSHQPTDKLLVQFGDTSAAAAEASRISAIIQYMYSDYWTETIRGLLIHSSSWKNEMLGGAKIADLRIDEKRKILRRYGYGVPNIEKALWCASNFSTLIIQQQITPFLNDRNEIKTNEVNFHFLPWPKDLLQELSSINIKLKITLSYFVEPNPTHRKYSKKYGYASHGLRFDLKKGTETGEEFKKRINRKAREDDDENSYTGVNWSLGPNARNVGSIHSDTWNGTTAELAEMDTIAIFPVSGWWRMRKRLERWSKSVRYSLIVSLEVDDSEIDIYTPIYNIVHTPISITT